VSETSCEVVTGSASLDRTVREHVERTRQRTIDLRRSLHRQPELAFQETATAAVAAARCEELGFDVRRGVAGTGVLADLDTGRPGPTVLVRADMDALPIDESDDGRLYRSQVSGVMHACGHDGHVAVGLAVADVLAALRSHYRGRVRMCFQPAEETDEGAAEMIAQGAVEGVDRAVGLHLIATQPTGTVALGSGVRWASSDELCIVVHGSGGHAGAPADATDPILAAAEIALALERLMNESTERVVVKLGVVRGGTAPNIVPETVELAGTLRAFGDEHRRLMLAKIRAAVDAVALDRGVTLTWVPGAECPEVWCDPDMTGRVEARLGALSTAEGLLELEPSTACDDMARFLQAVPGVYFTVGAGGPGAHPHHHPRFDIDEDALPVATEALTLATLALLER
jgi:amidohydrolase